MCQAGRCRTAAWLDHSTRHRVEQELLERVVQLRRLENGGACVLVELLNGQCLLYPSGESQSAGEAEADAKCLCKDARLQNHDLSRGSQ